ncbi:hypothetical protein PVAP13_4KG363188, partial [Panicum virgatum]
GPTSKWSTLLPRGLLLPLSFSLVGPHAPGCPEPSAPSRPASGGSLLHARLEGGGERGMRRRGGSRIEPQARSTIGQRPGSQHTTSGAARTGTRGGRGEGRRAE